MPEPDFPYTSLGPTLRIVVLIFLLVFAVLALLFVVVLAALPGQIAKRRHHPQADAINICGWVGLPTGILWAVAMVWAFLRSGISSNRSPGLDGGSVSLDEVRRLEQSVAALESIHSSKPPAGAK